MRQPTRRALAIVCVAALLLMSWASAQTPAEPQDGGLQSLLSDEFTLGGEASVAAGPVGRQAGAATDVKLDAQILSYSHSHGLFAGLELAGVVIKPDVDDMRAICGAGVTAKRVMQDAARSTPMAVQAFPAALGRYSTR